MENDWVGCPGASSVFHGRTEIGEVDVVHGVRGGGSAGGVADEQPLQQVAASGRQLGHHLQTEVLTVCTLTMYTF